MNRWWLVVVLGLALTGWAYVVHVRDTAHAQGYAEAMQEVQAVATAAQAHNDAVHRAQIETVKEAQDAREKKLVAAQADAGRMRGELERLRGTLEAAGGSILPAACANSNNEPGTNGDLQRILAQELERVSRQGAEMAEQCDRIVIERDALVHAWPK